MKKHIQHLLIAGIAALSLWATDVQAADRSSDVNKVERDGRKRSPDANRVNNGNQSPDANKLDRNGRKRSPDSNKELRNGRNRSRDGRNGTKP